MAADRILMGTSGWSYKEWLGPFYSKEDKSFLRAYSKVFNTAEIDSTFYRYPSKGMVMGWTRYSPEGFVFTAKLPKLITHDKKLDLSKGAEEDTQKFVELMEPLSLSGKLGCILIQLPPRCSYNPDYMEDFFKVLPKQVKFAIEFRHHSWMRSETWNLLQKYNVAYTVVDEPLLPPEVHTTANFAYFRWHGHGSKPWYDYEYKREELEPWVPKIKETSKNVEKFFGFFNNHYHGYAVENCLQVLEMLGVQTPQQASTKSKIENYLRNVGKQKESKLETFVEPRELSFDELMRYFTAAGRLERARSISDTELAISKSTDDRLEATLREYRIVIDSKSKSIMHDCADWEKIMSTKKLCKHIAKLLLSIDKQLATELLRGLYAQKESWQFITFAEKE